MTRILIPRLHDTTGCQTGCQAGLTTGLTAGCIVSTGLNRTSLRQLTALQHVAVCSPHRQDYAVYTHFTLCPLHTAEDEPLCKLIQYNTVHYNASLHSAQRRMQTEGAAGR